MSVSLESLIRGVGVAPQRASQLVELVSFLMVGGLAALAFAALSSLAIGLRTGVPAWQMSSLCYALMIGPAYLAHRRFSFRSSAPHRVALPRYVAVQLSAICLAALFSYAFYAIFHVPTPLAALLVAGLTAAVNFVVLRLWAFASVL